MDIDLPSDSQLVESWTVNQDETALAALISRHQPMVRGTACRLLRDRALAEDVVQETFVQLADQSGRITGPVEGWLRGVAGNLALMQLRALRRRQGRETRGSKAMAARSWQQEDDQRSELVAECVAELTPAERELIIDIFWEGRNQKEIASEYQVSAVTIHKRTRAALDSLRQKLGRRGLRIGAASLLLGLAHLSGGHPASTAWIGSSSALLPVVSLAAVGMAAAAGLALAVTWLTGPTGPAGQGPVPEAVLQTGPPVPASGPGTAAASVSKEPDRGQAGPSPLGLPEFCVKATPVGWSPSEPATWQFFLPELGTKQVRIGDADLDVVKDADGSQLRFRRVSGALLAIVPMPADHLSGHQLRLRIRNAEPGDAGAWHETLHTTLRVTSPETGDVVLMIVTRDGEDFGSVDLVGPVLMDQGFSMTGSPFQVGPSRARLGPWKGAVASIYTLTAETNWPFAAVAGFDIRQAQVRSLTSAERGVLMELIVRSLAPTM